MLADSISRLKKLVERQREAHNELTIEKVRKCNLI